MTLDAQINAAELSHFDRTELVTKSLRYWELHHKVFCRHRDSCMCPLGRSHANVLDYARSRIRTATSAELDEMIAELEERR